MRDCLKQKAVLMATAKQPPPCRRANAQRVDPGVSVEHYETTCSTTFYRKHVPAKEALLEAMVARQTYGVAKHGTALFTHNGRNAITDAFQEVLDALFYINQANSEGVDCKGAGLLATQLGVCLLEVAHQQTKNASKLKQKPLDDSQHDDKGG